MKIQERGTTFGQKSWKGCIGQSQTLLNRQKKNTQNVRTKQDAVDGRTSARKRLKLTSGVVARITGDSLLRARASC